jgi:hypothetical protein
VSRLQLAIEQIVFARNYTNGLLDQTPTTEWFRQPPGGVSHVAWQVGHIAFSEYRPRLTTEGPVVIVSGQDYPCVPYHRAGELRMLFLRAAGPLQGCGPAVLVLAHVLIADPFLSSATYPAA